MRTVRPRATVTGGAGFIGSHVVDAALHHQYDVTVLDNFSTGQSSNLSRASETSQLRIVRCDILNERQVAKALINARAVFHLAAIASVPKSIEDPVHTYKVNAQGTLNLLKAAVANKVERFVYASTCAVYGDGRSSKNREDDLPVPKSPYASSKLLGEYYCKLFNDEAGLETVILRYFNAYGHRQRPGPYSGVMLSFLQSAMKNKPLVIYGDGKQTRDFVHVSDIVQANLRVLESKRDLGGQVFNIGTGKATEVNELAILVKETIGHDRLKVVHRSPLPGDVRNSCADIRLSRSKLGYKPRIGLRKGLEELTRELT